MILKWDFFSLGETRVEKNSSCPGALGEGSRADVELKH